MPQMTVSFNVSVPDGYKPADVSRVIGKMLEIGQNDAAETNDNPDLATDPDSELAEELDVGEISVFDWI